MLCRAVPCRAVLCCAVIIPLIHASLQSTCSCRCTSLSLLPHADGTLAERVVLGKRRREQLGIQSASDMHDSSSQSTSARQPDESLHGAPGKAATGPLTGAPGSRGPSGKAVGPAEGMMAKWGYTPGHFSVALYRLVCDQLFLQMHSNPWMGLSCSRRQYSPAANLQTAAGLCEVSSGIYLAVDAL